MPFIQFVFSIHPCYSVMVTLKKIDRVLPNMDVKLHTYPKIFHHNKLRIHNWLIYKQKLLPSEVFKMLTLTSTRHYAFQTFHVLKAFTFIPTKLHFFSSIFWNFNDTDTSRVLSMGSWRRIKIAGRNLYIQALVYMYVYKHICFHVLPMNCQRICQR